MKNIIKIFCCLLCAGCFPEPLPKPTLLEELGESPDGLDVVEVYLNNYAKCGLNGMLSAYSCKEEQELAEPGTKFECVGVSEYDYSGKEKKFTNTSDECILYRRSSMYHETKVNYFDYKRFLGVNSPIKTDDDFLNLVQRYEKIAECDNLLETTTFEKELCKEKIKAEINLLATREMSCDELVPEEYTKYLKEEGQWFDYAINHDPNAYRRLLIAIGEYEAARWSYAPVLSRKDAQKEIEKDITEFGKEHFCSTKNWKTQMKKLGFKI